MVDSRDLISAARLWTEFDPIITATLAPTSPIHARYKMNVAQLLTALGSNRPGAVKALLEASALLENLEIEEATKQYRLGVANNLASVLSALDDAQAGAKIHASHPLAKSKAAMFERTDFQDTGAFYFAVTDIFLSAVAQQPPDKGWLNLFKTKPEWNVAEAERAELESYYDFAAGLLHKRPDLLMLAARTRIDDFANSMRANLERFPLPTILDRIVIAFGMVPALSDHTRDGIDLLVRGSEVLNRNARHHIADVAIMLASEKDEKLLNALRSYIHLVQSKRAWEIEHLRQAILGAQPDNIHRYDSLVENIERAKAKIAGSGDASIGFALPSLATLQSQLAEKQAFVTLFDLGGVLGKVCVTRDQSISAYETLQPADYDRVKLSIRLLGLSLTATHAPDPALDAQYPVEAAVYLGRIVFGGLEACLEGTRHVVMAAGPDFAGTPFGALLREAPPSTADGFDLSKADWFIRDFSFSVAISARHFLASVASTNDSNGRRNFLGIGDPKLDAQGTEVAAAMFRGSLPTADGLAAFSELPETGQELAEVADLLAAPKDDLLLREGATEEKFRLKPLAEYDVIHFATHGLLKEDLTGLTGSALLLTPGEIEDPYDDGLLQAAEISRLSLGARLIVLSACNTAKYDISDASQGVQDLQAAFTVAGTPTLLGSLWPIETRTAQEIVGGFYHAWRSGLGAADALAVSTRAYLAREDAAHQHPRFWAPFVIVGNGDVQGSPATNSPANAQISMKPLPHFKGGGEVLGIAEAGEDVVLTAIADWNGEKMDGIIARISPDGTEKWRINSREIGVSKTVAGSDSIYAIGFVTSRRPIPVIRALRADGSIEWAVKLENLSGYTIGDVERVADELLLIATPTGHAGDLVLVVMGPDGKVIATKAIAPPMLRSGGAFLASRGDRLLVAVSAGGSLELDTSRSSLFEIARACHRGESTTLIEVDRGSRAVTATATIPDFKVTALETRGERAFLGGESLDGCSPRGTAGMIELGRVADLKPGAQDYFWKDDDVFNGTVAGIAFPESEIVLAIERERSVSLNSGPGKYDAYIAESLKPNPDPETLKRLLDEASQFGKRFAEREDTAREVSIVRLTESGAPIASQYLSSGLSMTVGGLTTIAGRPVLYGTVGGLPALSQ